MSRQSKGPRLAIDNRGNWVIRDGQTMRGTGCPKSDRAGAERKLAEYIVGKHSPIKELESADNPNQAKIVDVLSLEIQRFAARDDMPKNRKLEMITLCENMADWFSAKRIFQVGQLNGKVQRAYAEERNAPSAAYRDLKILAAAINRNITEEMGGAQTKFRPVLPPPSEPRERWLSRNEAARMLWKAWRARRDGVGRHTSRHVARFLLVGIYTGSRKGDICGAALIPTIGRGYVDLDRGIFKRKPDNKKETSKRQPTVPIPPRLLLHLRRWHRLGISRQAVVEFNGRPISEIKSGFQKVV